MTALIVAHGHPQFSKGGAEIAAYRIYKALQKLDEWSDSVFLAACTDNNQLKPGCEIFGLSKSEFLVRRSSDPFLHDTNINLTRSTHGFLYHSLKNLNPSVIHIHHYIHIGMDLLHALKRWFPRAKIIFTLHEYYGLCPYEGRLLQRSGHFCKGPEPDQCLSCVGEEKLVKLAVRRLRIEHFFSAIDHFISPSLFLAQRYIEWGLIEEKISIIENLPLNRDASSHDSRDLAVTSCKNQSNSKFVFSYFGQVNKWKGIDIILDAFSIIVEKYSNVRLELHGFPKDLLSSSEDFHDQEFLATCSRLIRRLPSDSIRLMGVYNSEELDSRMKGVDVIVMASRWYENAPMVIQESFTRGVPVIAPAYGGMAEKITDNFNGFLYDRCDSINLSNIMAKIVESPKIASEMSLNAFKSSLCFDAILDLHLGCYAGKPNPALSTFSK